MDALLSCGRAGVDTIGSTLFSTTFPGASAMADEKSTDWGSWAANDEQKLTMGLRATPAQRLAWLEE
jgi:hypothetical protein